MSENFSDTPQQAQAKRRRISPVWLVPFIALLIAIALGVKAWQEKGEEVTIIFDTAGGIEVGKTEVRLKDVPVGKVTQMKLSADLSQVHATVMLDKSMSRHLSEHTRFWLVTPRISASGISNLGTLVSGVYIVMDPGAKGARQRDYMRLSEPPAVQSDDKGTQYVVRAETLGSLDIGSPVYFRQLRVGEVVNYKLSKTGSHVDARLFVEAPYDQFVAKTSRFWNVSGLDVSVGLDGVTAQMASISSLLLGGVTFDSPASVGSEALAPADHTFILYANEKAAEEGEFTLSYPYLALFSHSVKGLKVGAPVEFRGLKVGQVSDIQLSHVGNNAHGLSVTLLLEPQRFNSQLAPTREALDSLLVTLIEQGLKAQIKASNLLLGGKFIDLHFVEAPAIANNTDSAQKDVSSNNNVSSKKDASSRKVVATNEMVAMKGALLNAGTLPTVDQPLDKVEQQLAKVAESLSRFPTEAIGQDMAASLRSLNEMLALFDREQTAQALSETLHNTAAATEHFEGAMEDARAMLGQLTVTLKSVDHTIAPDSQMHAEFLETLQAVSEASDSFDRFVEELYRYPSSLVFGLGKDEE